jgi:hypothetical protein
MSPYVYAVAIHPGTALERVLTCVAAESIMQVSIPWHLVPLEDSQLPSPSRRSLPDAVSGACELCGRRPPRPLSTVLVIDGPDGLPVPFLICAQCRRALDELHALLESASQSA